MTPSDIAAIASATFAGVSSLLAAVALYMPARKQASQKLLEQAELSLERAYEALTDDGQHTSPPRSDRLNWLTAARHIEGYKKLKSKLTDDTHVIVCEEQEEYWRHRFYLALRSQDLLQRAYYANENELATNGPIEYRSAVIVFAFAKWPDSRQDPIDGVDIESLISQTQVLNGRPGLRAHMEQQIRRRS